MNLLFFGTSSAIPYKGNGYTSFLVAIGNYRILIDTGDNPVRALLESGEDPRVLDAVVLTHTHIDHLGAFPSLISALDCMKREKPLKIIASPETWMVAESLLRHFPLDPSSLSFPLEYGETLTGERRNTWERKNPIEGKGGLTSNEQKEPFRNEEAKRTDRGESPSTGKRSQADFILSLLPGKHAVPTSMVQILSGPLRFLYTSDYHHGLEVASPAGDVDILIHEATYPHKGLPSITSHSSALQAGWAAQKSRSQFLFLCHFEVSAYPNGIEEAANEARKGFDGNVIVPNLYQWYKIPDFL